VKHLETVIKKLKQGLVYLYDIWPGNWMGLFLQSWGMHEVPR